MTDPSACIFCAIVSGRAPAEVVWRDDATLAFMDIAPLAPGHVLIVPRHHCAALWEMPPEDGDAVMRTTMRVARAVMDVLSPDGLNLFHSSGEAAGQTVPHVHMHVVPRRHDDGFRPPIVPRRAEDSTLGTMAARIRAAL